jgi:hypothetical protein
MRLFYSLASGVIAVACAVASCSSSGPSITPGSEREDGGETRAEAGPETGQDFDSCSAPGDCVIASRSCCSGFPLPADFAAIRRDKREAWRQTVCPSANYTCDASLIINDKLLAYCVEGKCKEIFVPEDPISACSRDEDCVSVSSSCNNVTCGGPFPPFVFRADQVETFTAQTCPGLDARSVMCPAADRDAGAPRGNAVCGATGHCE